MDAKSGRPMQSAAKCPFLLVFHTAAWEGPESIGTRARPTTNSNDERDNKGGGGGGGGGGEGEGGGGGEHPDDTIEACIFKVG